MLFHGLRLSSSRRQAQRPQTTISLIQALGGGWIAPWASKDNGM